CQPEPTKDGQLSTWQQCGGNNYKGLSKCRDEDVCVKKIKTGAWGCVWNSQAPQKDAEEAEQQRSCSTNWSQCNGQNWPANNVCCQDQGFQCNFKNQYLSLCEPKPKKDVEEAEQQRSCSTNWSQCNGQNWPANNVCCQDQGFQCNFKNQYLSLCEPKPKKDAEDAEQATQPRFAQCGGQGYNGQNWPDNDKCQFWNQWYSQCVPKN
ncbi:hypothetical protein As57867_007615, partial [Aphanomyces stellatus]